MNNISSFSTAEAFAESLTGRNTERWSLFVVERAQSDIVYSPASESNKFGYYVYNLCSIEDTVYGGLVYHFERRK
jgi:hypothetical protein